ncbi:MAG TPA: hypothetical protein VG099_28865 [Gemmataceae bacterium]|nr:hypothetical protein [Gemmataceae bacterium]
MLTSYMVRCPQLSCAWFGSLLPSQDTDSWRGSVPTIPTAVFQCPDCGHSWRARVVGDDVVALEEEPLHLA